MLEEKGRQKVSENATLLHRKPENHHIKRLLQDFRLGTTRTETINPIDP